MQTDLAPTMVPKHLALLKRCKYVDVAMGPAPDRPWLTRITAHFDPAAKGSGRMPARFTRKEHDAAGREGREGRKLAQLQARELLPIRTLQDLLDWADHAACCAWVAHRSASLNDPAGTAVRANMRCDAQIAGYSAASYCDPDLREASPLPAVVAPAAEHDASLCRAALASAQAKNPTVTVQTPINARETSSGRKCFNFMLSDGSGHDFSSCCAWRAESYALEQAKPQPVAVPESAPVSSELNSGAAPAPGKAPLRLEDFTPKSVIVRGATKEHLERIRSAAPKAARFYHRKGEGWVFSRKRLAVLRADLADLLAA